MRNLKKFLALVMAMVMAFSLMVTVNAAHIGTQYTDEDDVTPAFEEAMEVLTGMGVYQGDPGATFRPASTITRAETAALIYRLATGDTTDARKDLYKDYGNFADVSSTDWFAGYVGYCANAGYIKGHGGYFNPYGQVTGYEVLAMVLRAVGYDKNHEFEGATWQTNVSALSTQLGVLKQVKSTDYGDRLYEASRRDVVASLIFETAQIPTVNYTAMAGYNKYTNLINNELNPSLGYKNFGLTTDTGVIVGNQETGESNTRISFASEKDGTEIVKGGKSIYAYAPVLSTYADFDDAALAAYKATPTNETLWAINTIRTFKFETGLDDFAHSVKVWYNAKDTGDKTTYAMFDKSTLTTTVKATAATTAGDLTAKATDNSVAKAADKAGFKTGANVFINSFFARFNEDTYDKDAFAAAADDSPVDLYLLVSNSDDKALDVVIALNVESSQIRSVNNVGAVKTVGVPVTNGDGDTKYVHIDDVQATGEGIIEQKALVGDSTKDLKQYEIGVHVNGTNGTSQFGAADARTNLKATGINETAWFKLVAVTETTTGTVQAYNNDTGKVTLSDGRVLEQSVLYDTVVTDTIPQRTSYTNIGYKFYLDRSGKYLGSEPIYGASFLYGTYMDYATEMGSSTFKYYITGVTLDGEIVKNQAVEKYWDAAATDIVTITGTDQPGVPFRNASDAGANYIGAGIYRGFSVSDTTLDWNDYAPTPDHKPLDNLSVLQADDGTNKAFNNAIGTFDGVTTTKAGDIFIGKTAATLGVVKAGGDANVDGATTANDDLYFTENTKFILVSGYGTDSVKAEVYNGISELKGDSAYVILKMQNVVDNSATPAANTVKLPNIVTAPAAPEMGDMTYFTKSPFVYAQTGDTKEQADVVIMPRAAVERVGRSNLYFVGDPTPTLSNATGEKATQFTMYTDGEKVSVWLEGEVDNFNGATAGTKSAAVVMADYDNRPATGTLTECDKFFKLEPTGKTANDGQPIYKIVGTAITPVAAPSAGGVITKGTYVATSYSAQTATFTQATTALTTGTEMRNVANAKVANANLDASGAAKVWPDVVDLGTLNQASSLKAYGGEDDMKVCAVLNADNALIVDYIYVCFDQT